ncbi:MAG: hypothetical protein QM538_03290, partial [Methylacidiphilales bacterium]|nr:hypothetical protein [Candidatus Methylacidiphilales bacterium]
LALESNNKSNNKGGVLALESNNKSNNKGGVLALESNNKSNNKGGVLALDSYHKGELLSQGFFGNKPIPKEEFDKPFTSNHLSYLLQQKIIDGYAKNSSEIVFYKNHHTLYRRPLQATDTCCD